MRGVIILFFFFSCFLLACLDACKPQQGHDQEKKSEKIEREREKNLLPALPGELPPQPAKIEEPDPPSLPPGEGARVIVDVSGSMKGFIRKNSVTIETLHRVLDLTLSKLGVNTPLVRCLVGKELRCNEKELGYGEYQKASLYHTLESRLDLALGKLISPPAPAAPDQFPAAPYDPIDKAKIVVVVTDGMQAQTTIAQGNPDTQIACQRGSDPYCLVAILNERVRGGYGIWLFQILLPFEGTHFAERGLDAGHWERIQAHIAELGRDPFYEGIKFEARDLKKGKEGDFSYFFRGVKPLLFFILSRDFDLGRRLIQELKTAYEGEKIAAVKAGGIQTFEIFPGESKARLGVAKKFADRSKDVGIVYTDRSKDQVFVRIECGREGKGMLKIPVAFSEEEAKNISLIPQGTPLPEQVLGPPVLTQEGFDLPLKCVLLKPGNYTADYALASRGNAVGKPENAWWYRFHTDNSFEAPEKVYGLATLVLGVLEEGGKRPQSLDRLRVEIKRK